MDNYELPISPNYVCNWGIKEAIREILQNAVDGEKCGHNKEVVYDDKNLTLSIISRNTKLSKSTLVLGCSSKSDIDGMIGKFGEGYKLALVVLLRKGLTVEIKNADEKWVPSFVLSNKFGTQVLNISIEENNDKNKDDLNFIIHGVNEDVYNELLLYFPCIESEYGKVISSDNGDILLDPKFKGKMYVDGLYIQSDNNFKYGYNFNPEVVNLDRDRKAINYYELRKLTAASVITAEECSTELFKAISDSCTDIKDIKEVLDDASDEFLKEYRDMLYDEKNLDENTLVATNSVMKQLKQMNVDVPVIEGSEIESYLIAKANNKLGLIHEAEEKVSRVMKEDDAWYWVKTSAWMDLKCWFNQYCKNLEQEAKDEFEKIAEDLKPYELDYIDKYIEEDFIWTYDNFEKLEEQIKNQT